MWYLLVFAHLLLNSYTDALPAEPFIIYSNLTNIRTLDLNNFVQTNILGGLDYVVPLGVDTVDRHIYFGEHTLGRIYRSNYDGTSKTLIIDEVKNVEGVAIDWIGRKMYWTTYQSETIEVATLDGKYRKVLINAGLEYPRGMAVDPIAGYLFWSDWGAAAAIERCALDGTSRVALVKESITHPNGVTLDTVAKIVYWIDGTYDKISSIDYNGNNRKIIFEDSSLFLSQFHGFDLDITGDSIYYTDWLTNSIHGINKNTGVTLRTISVPTSKSIKGAMGLRVIDSSKQQSGTSNCGSTNGGCEQLCFHKVPSGTSCGCELGKKLADDGKKCEDAFKDEFVMFADADAGKIYQMQLDSINVRPIAIPFDDNTNIIRPVALEYDRVEDRVYWSDVSLHIICRAFRNGTDFEVLFDDVGVVDGLTIDLAGRQLYWTSTTDDTVETSKLDGSFRRTLIGHNLDEPRDIIVDPVGGYMYWTDWGVFPRIERARMDGEERIDLVNHTLGWPNGITLDHVYNKLYWADAKEDSIEVVDLATLERKVVLNKKFLIFGSLYRGNTQFTHPFGLTLLHDHIYWTDWRTNSVYRADVKTGANIVLMVGDLGKPMDIHAYRAIPNQEHRLNYTFSFPNDKGSTFTCISSRLCPVIPDPPQCPSGYTEVRTNQTCGLFCRDIVGYTRRCPCRDWMSCAVKEEYLSGCASFYYSSFRVRECKQEVRPGRCPSSGTQGSQQSCDGDSECPGNEKCCESKCTTPTSIDLHPCRTDNGGCDQLCFAVPDGHKCGCENGSYYSESESRCKSLTEPVTSSPTKPVTSSPTKPVTSSPTKPATSSPTKPVTSSPTKPVTSSPTKPVTSSPTKPVTSFPTKPTTSSPTLSTPTPTCAPHPAPADGSVTCDGNPVPQGGECRFECDTGYDLLGLSLNICYNGQWIRNAPTCEPTSKPSLSPCPNSTTIPTDPEKSYATYNWKVPTATDKDGVSLTVNIYPPEYASPAKLGIQQHTIEVSATDKNGEKSSCSFVVTVEDQETPTFNSTCPAGITLYTSNDYSVQLPSSFKLPVATDNAKPPTVTITGFPTDSFFPVGTTVVTFTAVDDAGLSASCTFSVTVVNVCDGVTCTHGAKCVLNSTTGNSHTCACNTVCPQVHDPLCGSDGKDYSSECFLSVAVCTTKTTITVGSKKPCSEVCMGTNCPYKGRCEVVKGKAQCTCELQCGGNFKPVCGTDLQSYDNECKMRKAGCNAKKNISVLVNAPCGCDELNLSSDVFKNTSKMDCQFSDNSVKCNVICKSGYDTVIPGFLSLQCYNNEWIRKNDDDSYVKLANVNSPPRCYEPKQKNSHAPYCEDGSAVVPSKDLCAPCPPGSYYDSNLETCASCEVTTFQDQPGQSSCKDCESQTTTMTSTARGAEGCFFDHSSKSVTMVVTGNKLELTKAQISKQIADALTDICNGPNGCPSPNGNSRKKRDTTKYEFKPENVIVLHIKVLDNKVETEIALLLLDPTSTSLLPNSSFTSKELENLIVKIDEKNSNSLPFIMKRVGNVQIGNSPTTGKPKSNTPFLAVGIAGAIILIGVVVAVWLYNRRRKNKRTASQGQQQMQFNPADGGKIFAPKPKDSMYEDPDKYRFPPGINNQVYAAPSHYEVSPIEKTGTVEANRNSHFYEMPVEEENPAFSNMDKLHDGAVVDIGLPNKSSYNPNAPVRYTAHRRSQPNNYHIPNIPGVHRTASGQADLRLAPPPRLNSAERDTAVSSMLTNVPRHARVDGLVAYSNADRSRPYYQNVSFATREHSES